jgi:hypothetical protein
LGECSSRARDTGSSSRSSRRTSDAGHLGQIGQAAGHLLALLHHRVAQHLDQQVGGHRALEGVDAAGRQADHVGQPLEQGGARPRRRLGSLGCGKAVIGAGSLMVILTVKSAVNPN